MLLRSPFYFARCTDNLIGTPGAATAGTNFTEGANDADGAAVEFLPALDHDVHYLVLTFAATALSGANSNALCDILVDPAGGTAWTELINALICGGAPLQTLPELAPFYHFPIFIHAGSSVGIRARSAHTANITTGRILAWAYGEPNRPAAWWCGSKVETIGAVEAESKGTDFTPVELAWSAWVNIGSVTSARYGAIQLGVGPVNGISATGATYRIQMGYDSVVLPGHHFAQRVNSTIEDMKSAALLGHVHGCDIPAGTQMQVRAHSNIAPQVINAAMYGVY